MTTTLTKSKAGRRRFAGLEFYEEEALRNEVCCRCGDKSCRKETHGTCSCGGARG